MSESSRSSEHIAAGPQDQAGGAAQGRALLARMDRLPGWPLARFDLFVLGLAYFFVFYDITDIGFGMPAIVKQFHLSDNDVKFVAIAVGLVGYIVGSNLIGALAHRRGRRLASSRCSCPAWDPSARRSRPGSSRCRSGVS
jgi:hypothetical protein